jgi:hypothetical protein
METDQSLPGRVVRLHFQCRAELPIGSSLRVTGSSLWAPTHVSAEDANHGQAITSQSMAEGNIQPSSTLEDWVDVTVLNQSHANMYTSSVAMYTTPETYPLWCTKRPVVIILNKSSGIHHHYYRYLVVTPGAQAEATQRSQDYMDDDGDTSDSESDHPHVATTSNENGRMMKVMLWEDPFDDLEGSNLCNLPYRTIDIDVTTTEVMNSERVDSWNSSDDSSFQPYLIRNAVRNFLESFISYFFIINLSSHSLHVVD